MTTYLAFFALQKSSAFVRILNEGDKMGLLSWLKKTTFEGTIKREIGEVSGSDLSAGKVKIVVQELEKKAPTNQRRFRLNVIFKALTTYRSMPVVLDESGMRRFVDILNEALENRSLDRRT